MNNFVKIIFILSLVAGSCLPATAQEPLATDVKPLLPDSLRVTITPVVYRWLSFHYEAEVSVTPLYPSDETLPRKDSLVVLIDVKPSDDVSFLVKSGKGEDDYVTTDRLIIYKDQGQIKGKITWLVSDSVTVMASFGTQSTSKSIGIKLPMLLMLLSLGGGVLGGWLRRHRDPKSVMDLPVNIFSEVLSRRIEPFRELFISALVGFLIYLLNEYSPVSLQFSKNLNEGWLVLGQPLLIGFLGGWGGSNLLVGMLSHFNKGVVKPAREQGRPAKQDNT